MQCFRIISERQAALKQRLAGIFERQAAPMQRLGGILERQVAPKQRLGGISERQAAPKQRLRGIFERQARNIGICGDFGGQYVRMPEKLPSRLERRTRTFV